MATQAVNEVKEVQLLTTTTPLISTTSNVKKQIITASLTNTSTDPVTVTIWLLNSATVGTTGVGGNWKLEKTLAGKEEFRLSKMTGVVIDFSMKLESIASVSSVINVNISVYEITA